MDIAAEEKRLIGRARNGDQKAFEALYEANAPRIRELVSRRTGTDLELDDLVQVTFTRAFLNLERFRGDSAFTTWLFRIGLNVCASHLRSLAVQRTHLPTSSSSRSEAQVLRHPWEGDGPEMAFLKKERRHLVRQTIRNLPRRYREPARLRFLHDRSYEEIERELEIPMGTVKCRLWRARERLREDLRRQGLWGM